MANFRLLFAKAPPREPLTSLAAIRRDWNWRFVEGDDGKRRDLVIHHCKIASSFPEAVDRACRSRNPAGKMYNHQSKIPLPILLEFRDLILEQSVVLFGMGPGNFDIVHALLWDIRPWGIGPVTTYDVSVRIGAYLGQIPSSVYLHAGVREGWNALLRGLRDIDMGSVESWRAEPLIIRGNLPEELRDMPADEVEDFLCCYRSLFPYIEKGELS